MCVLLIYKLPYRQLRTVQVLITNTLPDAYLDQFARAVQAHLLSQLCCAEHLRREVVDVGDGLGANSLEGRNDFVLLHSVIQYMDENQRSGLPVISHYLLFSFSFFLFFFD